jgi:hypothetical protein
MCQTSESADNGASGNTGTLEPMDRINQFTELNDLMVDVTGYQVLP